VRCSDGYATSACSPTEDGVLHSNAAALYSAWRSAPIRRSHPVCDAQPAPVSCWFSSGSPTASCISGQARPGPSQGGLPMTLPKRLYTRPADIHPSPLRATARNAGVSFNSDDGLHNAHSSLLNQPRFCSGNRTRCLRAQCALALRTLAGHLALIEIP